MKTAKLLALLPALLLAACAEEEASGDIAAANGDATSGEALYADNCSGCHGSAGEGGTGPAIAGNPEGDAETAEVVQNGEDEMPAFPDLTDQDISDILAYLETL